jgi:hypothetical protein
VEPNGFLDNRIRPRAGHPERFGVETGEERDRIPRGLAGRLVARGDGNIRLREPVEWDEQLLKRTESAKQAALARARDAGRRGE